MNLFNFLRSVFGFPSDPGLNRYGDPRDAMRNEFRNPPWDLNDGDDIDEDFELDSFMSGSENIPNVFADDGFFRMHTMFQRHMNELLQSFGLNNMTHFPPTPFQNMLEPPEENQASPKSLRDKFLKPSSELPSKKESLDSDLGKSSGSITPFIKSFGCTITSETVSRPDGGYETIRRVRDSQGNEEVTVTRKVNGQVSSVTTKSVQNGKQDLKDFFPVPRDLQFI